MCEYCCNLNLKCVFTSPSDYEMTAEYIKELIDLKGFLLIEGNCGICEHKDSAGQWIDDVIYHVIKCPKCKQVYSCSINTYRGGGIFKKDQLSKVNRKIKNNF